MSNKQRIIELQTDINELCVEIYKRDELLKEIQKSMFGVEGLLTRTKSELIEAIETLYTEAEI